jgi:predicted transcriptional regulator
MTDCRPTPPGATPDRVLKALAHSDRRAVLNELATADGETLTAETLAARVEAIPDVELYHRHLPKLADAGLVVFDSDTGRVEYTPTDSAEAILAVVADEFDE